MAKDSQEWTLSHYVFPEEGDAAGNYEHDVPYKVEISTDPAVGERRTVKLSQDEQDEVRERYAIPAETITYDRNDPPAAQSKPFGARGAAPEDRAEEEVK